MNNNATFDKGLPLAIGADHAGFDYKETIKRQLAGDGWQLSDKGTYSLDSVDYPDFAHPVAAMVADGTATAGILICGSGNGVCMTANKHPAVRAALCWNEELASLARQHNNANIICFAARFTDKATIEKSLHNWFATDFEAGRHQRRVNKIEPCS